MSESMLEKLIVRLWNRQYYLAYEAPDSIRTRIERRILTQTARWLIAIWEKGQ